jgi:predicted HicB family RNase H-like nuclease
MESKNPKDEKERMIHVRLPEAMHKKVRIRAAETDQTIQDWVFEAIKRELERQGYVDGKTSKGKN